MKKELPPNALDAQIDFETKKIKKDNQIAISRREFLMGAGIGAGTTLMLAGLYDMIDRIIMEGQKEKAEMERRLFEERKKT
jgi:hypothetical protein